MESHARSFDFILDTVSAQHDLNAYLALLKRDGTLTLVGIPPQPVSVAAFTQPRPRPAPAKAAGLQAGCPVMRSGSNGAAGEGSAARPLIPPRHVGRRPRMATARTAVGSAAESAVRRNAEFLMQCPGPSAPPILPIEMQILRLLKTGGNLVHN